MKYLKLYSNEWDEYYQNEITDELAENILNSGESAGVEISDIPFEKIPIRSRFMSEANAQRYADYK